IILFARDWYNRAGVDRVMGFCTAEESERFLFVTPMVEREMVVQNGIILRKYFLDISQDEQRRRFEARIDAPVKHWKLSPMDVELLGPDGVSDFASLHSGRHNERAHLYAFDMLAGDGEDHRQLPLSLRKTNLARLLKQRIPGVFIAEYEQGEIGRDLFRVACNMGLEGIVSKRCDRAYTPGKC